MADREMAVLEVLREEGFARIPTLAHRLTVSESTIRRILARLDEQGKISRALGGAMLSARQHIQPAVRAFDDRKQVALAEKVAIAKAAAALVGDGDTVFLGGGSTVGQMPQYLLDRSLQVVTNSLAIASQFEDCPSTEVLVTGGYLFPRHRLLSGPVTLATLRDMHFTWAFVSAGAFTVQTLTDWNVMIAEVTREALKRGERGVALVDSTKFNRQHLARVAELSSLDYLISGALPEAAREAIRSAGVRYIQAEVEPHAANGDGLSSNGHGRERALSPELS
jgi:DeoR/GlpR family transcriptional regulator of sugar metabolism